MNNQENSRQRIAMNVETIIKIVCDAYSVHPRLIYSQTKAQPASEARQVCMCYFVTHLGMTTAEAANAVNRSNHATAVHARKRVEGLMSVDRGFKKRLVEISRKIMDTIPIEQAHSVIAPMESAFSGKCYFCENLNTVEEF